MLDRPRGAYWVAGLALALSPVSSLAQSAPKPLTDQYCLGCHNSRLSTAGVSLQGLDPTKPGEDAAVWEKVLRKLQTGEMPPQGLPRPDDATLNTFSKSLESALDKYAAANPNPGRPAVHRLNRAEYSNAIRDLLALDIDAGADLPADDASYGFDNIADVLSMSPALLERYMSVGRRIARTAIGDKEMKAVAHDFEPQREPPGRNARPRNERIGNGLPFNSAGGLVIEYYFPLDADYSFKIRRGGNAVNEILLPVKAGLHTIGVTFLREETKPEVGGGGAGGRRGGGGGGARAGAGGDALPTEMDLRIDGAGAKRWKVQGGQNLSSLTIDGPHNVTGRGDTASRQKIFTCRPAAAKDEEPCAREIVTNLARLAFRRPASKADVDPLLRFYQEARKTGDFDEGIEAALRTLLVSPDFLFRAESAPKNAAPGSVHQVSDVDLASRLSFFLWSSIPDNELLTLAEQNKLHDKTVLDQQIKRMLADPKADALTENFAGQWLFLRNLDLVKPDVNAFRGFDEALRASLRTETELFFQSILHENRSVLDLIDADYTFVNARLAEYYGIPGIYGSQFRRITVTDPNRRGLLGQGSILTVTSYPNRTSVVQRGKWILENLLGAPPPPPPPNVPALEESKHSGEKVSLRQMMERHRAIATCASCHARMDPIGFALENFNGVGEWRDVEDGITIDAAGKLPDGTEFDGPAGLRKLIATQYRDRFAANVTQKLMVYALGRGVEHYDLPVIRAIVRDAARDDYRIGTLISQIIHSTPFQMRRTTEQ